MGLLSWILGESDSYKKNSYTKANIYTRANNELCDMAIRGIGTGSGGRFEGMTFTEMAQALVREGANPNVNFNGHLFLTRCLQMGRYGRLSSTYPKPHIIHALLEAGADPNAHDEGRNTTPFHIALNDASVCIEVGHKSINRTWDDIYACAYYFEIIVDMLKHGGSVDTLREYPDILNYLKNPDTLNSEYLSEKIKSYDFNPNDYGI